MPDSARINIDTYREGLVPLIIGVSGHRDLIEDEIPEIRSLVRAFFVQLTARFPDRKLHIISPLAEGADRVVAEEALKLGLSFAVPLPMPREIYVDDFESEASRQGFEDLCQQAETIYELPIASGVTPEELREYGKARNLQYARLGVFLCAHSHILLALWDGKPSDESGGTAQVVEFHHNDVMVGFDASGSISQQLLADDESDLVYHVVVSRDREGGTPLAGLDALSCSWFTTDEAAPRTAKLPKTYVRIFDRTSDFNRDAKQHASIIQEKCYPLLDERSWIEATEEIERIDRIFCAADWLASHYQSRMLGALRAFHGLAFVMGMMFVLYSDLEARRFFLVGLIVCLVGALVIHRVAARGNWHSKYLEYRTLAEGLRVQFYWAVGGVTSEIATKYSHDNFLQKQDIELGWIRNVMRVAGIGCDVSASIDPKGLAFVLDEWIGEDETGGQLKYYRSKATSYLVHSRRNRRLGQIVGITVPLIILWMLLAQSDSVRDPLFVILGALLLFVSVRQSYAFKVAEAEVIKQYEFMYRIFRNARRRLNNVSSDSDRRRILRALGESALDEHAEWILLHRDRPLDQGSLWRMEI